MKTSWQGSKRGGSVMNSRRVVRANMKRTKVILRKPTPMVTEQRVIDTLQDAGSSGLTARQLFKRLGVDGANKSFIAVMRTLSHPGNRVVRSEYVQCSDWKEHHAIQESRYWLTEFDPKPEIK